MIFVLFYLIFNCQTNFINWVFIVLVLTNFAFIVKNDNKLSTISWSVKIATILKYYSATILILDILFIVFVGEFESTDPDSLDQKMKKKIPFLYNNLDLIGFRTYYAPGETVKKLTKMKDLAFKFIEFIGFLMISIYLEGSYKQKLGEYEENQDKDESVFKKLFEFNDNRINTLTH